VDEGATQCGFCTPGFIVALAGFLLSAPRWDAATGLDAVAGNICRCTGYVSIRRAVERVCASLGDVPPQRLPRLVERGLMPAYFLDVPDRLRGHPAGTNGVPVAGGTDLFVQRPDELAHAGLNFLSRREDLRGIRAADGVCHIGAATPLADLEDAPPIPGTGSGIPFDRVAADPAAGDYCGNLVNASPIGDPAILLLALDASVELPGRTVRLREFFLGYKRSTSGRRN